MKEKIYTFMQGRYGNDTLNQFLVIMCMIILGVNFVFNIPFLTIVAYILWIIALYRMLSKQIYKRNSENEKFLQLCSPIVRKKTLHQKRKQDPTHKYYRCPQCQQIVRLPKGHGKVIVTCPKCQNQFEKRT